MRSNIQAGCFALMMAVLFPLSLVFSEDPNGANTSALTRHEKPPRKVIIGTTMTGWYSDYPGLIQRIQQIRILVDTMSTDAKKQYGRSLDLALFTEYAVTAGKSGPAPKVAVSLTKDVLDACSAIAREHNCYLVFGGVFNDHPNTKGCTNEAIVIGRKGELVGRYVKVHPVLDGAKSDGEIVFEGGVQPGGDYNVFDLDFGRVGIQICYDVEFPEGWRRLAAKGAEVIFYPTQSPQLTRTSMYAAMHEYWVVSSTFRNNASFFEPGTGLIAAQIKEPKQSLVHEIDLSYVILPWSSALRNGEAFLSKYGNRVGYRYSESEDRGVFWSNDPEMTIGQMASSIGLLDTATLQQARARQSQVRVRGGEAD